MNLRGSSLVFSLIVLSFLLVSALSVATVSVTARRSSLSSKNSNISFQVADSAAELVLKQIYQVNDKGTPIDHIHDIIGTCATNEITGSTDVGEYTAVFYENTGTVASPIFSPISCGEPLWRAKVIKIKFQGTYRETIRAIEVSVAPPCNPVKDADNNTYQTVLIGTQCWMSENLNVGTMILSSVSPSDNGTIEKFCYSDTSANCASDGGLYQWDEMMKYSSTSGAQGICPVGWHIPTSDEFTTLERTVCTSSTCVTDFPLDTSTFGLTGTNEGALLSDKVLSGTNSSGFSVLLTGVSFGLPVFFGRGVSTFIWTSDTYNQGSNPPISRSLQSNSSQIYRGYNSNQSALSVRCLKN